MAESPQGFYLTLPSNSSLNIHPNNKPEAYSVQLSQPITLAGNWEVALMEIQYPNNWHNLTEQSIWNLTATRMTEEDDKPKQDIINCQVQVRIGNFPTIQALCEHVTNEIAEAVWKKFPKKFDKSQKVMKVEFHEATQRTRLVPVPPFTAAFIHCTTGKQLLQMLGWMEESEAQRFTMISSEFHIYKPPRIRGIFQSMYIYCDAVAHQIVGDTKAPLLRTINLGMKNRPVAAISFDRPFYVPIMKNYISTLEIELRNDSGHLMRFPFGKTILVLHFRRRNG